MIGLGDVNIREASTIRFIQATTAALQGVSGMAIFANIVPAKVAAWVVLLAAFFQIWLAAWNSGLHNEPSKPYEPPKLP